MNPHATEATAAVASPPAAGPATSFGLNSAYGPIDDFFAVEAMAQAVAFGSREFAEGVSAFLDKRKADFKNA